MKNDGLFFGFTKKFWLSSAVVFAFLWWFINKVGTTIMLPFGFALITAYIFSSTAERITRQTKLPKSIIAIGIVTLLFSLLIIFCIAFIPIAIRNIYAIIHYIPQLSNTLQNSVSLYIPTSIQNTVMESYSQLGDILTTVTQTIFSHFQNFSSFFAQMFTFFVITPIASYYMIKDWSAINEHIMSLIPKRHRTTFISLRTEIRKRLAGYIVGQIYIIIFLSTFYGCALFLIDLEFGVTIGILTGIASIVPYIGLTSGFAASMIICLLKGKTISYIGIVIGIFVIGQVIEGSFLTPKLMSNKIDIHPLWIVFGFLVCGIFFGFFGIFFAVPITAIASVLIKFYVNNYYKKRCI